MCYLYQKSDESKTILTIYNKKQNSSIVTKYAGNVETIRGIYKDVNQKS